MMVAMVTFVARFDDGVWLIGVGISVGFGKVVVLTIIWEVVVDLGVGGEVEVEGKEVVVEDEEVEVEVEDTVVVDVVVLVLLGVVEEYGSLAKEVTGTHSTDSISSDAGRDATP